MRDYLEDMAAPSWMPYPDVSYPRIIGANGPKMVALAGEVADGALPATPAPGFTAKARQLLGRDKLLVVFIHSVMGQGAAQVAASVREHLKSARTT